MNGEEFDMFASPSIVPNDPYWQTDTLAASEPKGEADEGAQRRADGGARAAFLATQADKAARRAAASAALEKHDDDFRALRISIVFDDGEFDHLSSDYAPEGWELDDNEAVNAGLVGQVVAQIIPAIAPWVSHYHAMRLIRADGLESHMMAGLTVEDAGPTFYLTYRGVDGNLDPAALGSFPEVTVYLAALPDTKLTIRARTEPVNATLLLDAIRQCSAMPGRWGGEPTTLLMPSADESRDAWLNRVSLPVRSLERGIERWVRSGGNLDLYGLFGSAGERAAGDKPIEWVIPGLIPRGYVTLLVGTKMAGKSTLLGEMVAVIDSECQSRRSVLGVEVTARGIGGIVSGEDGDNFINRRADFYAPVHGDAKGLVIDIANLGWPKTLALLWEVPKIDFLVIDPLRAIMQGDEDSSAIAAQVFDDLNALARAKNCAIVLVHHLTKIVPRSLSMMLQAVRGSGAITDRPRIVIAMIDRGSKVTEVGIIKHNIPPSEKLWGEVNVGRLFRQDAATLTLVPLEGATRRDDDPSGDPAVLDLIFKAIEYQNGLRSVLRRTGKCELFERKAPHLVGLSRSALRDGVATLLASGRIVDGQDGLTVVRPENT